jgi:DNA-binding IclR family transcriptional regulator
MPVKSTLLDKSFKILERITVSPEPVTLKELAADLGLNTSTVSRIASDLAARNLIRKAGYHSFVPSTGLMLWGQCAHDTPLIRTVSQLLRGRSGELTADICFSCIESNHLVHLCKDVVSESDFLHNKIPLWRSPLAAVILYKDTAAAQAYFDAVISEENSKLNTTIQKSSVFTGLLESTAKDGFSIFKDPRIGWSVTYPVNAAGQSFALSFSGRDVDKCNMERMLFECSRLASRLTSVLNGLFY